MQDLVQALVSDLSCRALSTPLPVCRYVSGNSKGIRHREIYRLSHAFLVFSLKIKGHLGVLD